MQNITEFPLVSIIIPAYNHEKYVGQTIKSMLRQTYKNIEIIIINDGSSDMTHEEILKYIPLCKERFVRFEYRSRENRGLSATLNEMILWSKGKYISICASDDMFLEDKIEILVHELNKLDNSYAVICGNAIFIDEQGRNIDLEGIETFVDYYLYNRYDITDIHEQFGNYKTLISGNYIPAMSTLIRRDALIDIGLYTENIRIEDWDMWLKLCKKYKFKYINKVVAYYRWHKSNSVKKLKKQLLYDSIRILLREKDFAFSRNYKNEWLVSYLGRLFMYLLISWDVKFFFHYLKKINSFKVFPIFISLVIYRLYKKSIKIFKSTLAIILSK
ncbi:hypothetical protein CULT_1620013 [[Clostridium] ultunense Esp]|nr:hypothetical protein CULT_1620013 [[Clostridium] ultunense Esp]